MKDHERFLRSQGCGHKMEDVVRHWPRMAAMLVAQDVSTGWRLGVSRAQLLNGVSCLQKAHNYD